MSTAAVRRFIDTSGSPAVPPLFSVIDDAMGPCDDGLDIRCQAELKAAFHRRCAKMGKTMGERMRELMALDALGEKHVRSLMAQHCDVIGSLGGQMDPAVRTTSGAAIVPTTGPALS